MKNYSLEFSMLWRPLIFFSTVLLSVWCQIGQVKEIFVTEGQDNVLECQFHVDYKSSQLQFYWLKSGENFDSIAFGNQSFDDSYAVQLMPTEGRYRLFIRNTTYKNDNRQFVCKVRDGSRVVHEQKFTITVLTPPGPPEIRTPNTMATEGKSYPLTCSSVGGSPDPDLQWFREGDSHPLQGSLQPGGRRDKPTINSLNFEPKKEDDGARLICRVSSKALEHSGKPSLETSVEINVNYIPRVIIHPRNVILVERGTLATATCRMEAKPEPISIKWTHNGRVAFNGANLSFKPINMDDAGIYACVVDNGLGTTGQAELTIDMLYGPTVHVESKREVRENDDVTVRCNASANPPAEIQWFKEDDPTFMATGDILRLQRITTSSMGRYICQATNILRPTFATSPIRKIANTTVAIWIKHAPGKSSIIPENPIGVEGRSLTLTCQVSPPGWPEPSYKWWKDVPSNTLPYGMNYTISQVRTGNEGTYYCQAMNDLGISNVASVNLKVYEPPRITTQLQSQMSKRVSDTDLSISCEAQSKPLPTVSWLKNGNIINDEDPLTIVTSDSVNGNGVYTVTTTLRFIGHDRPNNNQLTVDDRGVYTCLFDNKVVEPVTSNMTLKIDHGPILRYTKKKVAFDLGSTAILECRMQAYPTPTFQWSFSNTIIASGMQQYLLNQTDLGSDLYLSVLNISPLKDSDYGEYTCSASNQLDTAKTHIRLVPRGEPDAPTELIPVNISYNSISLQWTSGYDGGYPDTSFLVSYWSASVPGQYTECGTSNHCVIGALSEMTDYHFRVKAKNERGESENSDEITIQTKIDPVNIPSPTFVYYNKNEMEISFSIPNTPLRLVGKLEILKDDVWSVYDKFVPIHNQEARISYGPQLWETIQVMQITLCLENDTNLCGAPLSAVEGVPPILLKASASGVPTQVVIVIAVCSVLGVLFLTGVIIACYFCKCRETKEKNLKKNFELETPNSVRPKAITKPYYPEGIINKAVDNGADSDDTKVPPYGDKLTPMNNQQQLMARPGMEHHISNGHMPPAYPYLEGHYSNSNGGSVDSQDSLWLKANGDVVTDRSYSYDPSLSNAYMYPSDDYHHVQEDMMNQRNKEYIYNSHPYGMLPNGRRNNEPLDSYRDVSTHPDPYVEADEKPPHMSFDESLESGYSTPNSRNRRVIREIIV